jgi:hypothetical protein
MHRPKFEAVKRNTPMTDTPMPENHRPIAAQYDSDRNHNKHGRKEDQKNRRPKDVKNPFCCRTIDPTGRSFKFFLNGGTGTLLTACHRRRNADKFLLHLDFPPKEFTRRYH